jgi:dienelactone hydrolase
MKGNKNMKTKMNRFGRWLLAAALVGAWLGNARAEETECDSGATPEIRTYFKAKEKELPKSGPRCQYNEKGNCIRIELKGYLYLPDDTSKPAPILIYNHGSGQDVKPGSFREIGHYFTKLGYVVFIPHRFGHGCSTGTYFGKVCEKEADEGACQMKFLHEQVDDVDLAIKYVKSLKNKDGTKLGDGDRVAIMGHSFGGIITQFANTRDLGQKAVVDVAGGSQSWNWNKSARDELKDAVAKGVAPTLFFEPMNDKSIEPALVLPMVAGRHCRLFETILFPPTDSNGDGKITAADYEDDPRDTAHTHTMNHTKTYGPAVQEFLTRYFTEPAKPFDKLCEWTSSQPQDPFELY